MRMGNLGVWIAAIGLVLVCGFVTSAQVIDASACEQACYERESSCVSACDGRENPVECEASCHDEVADCLEQCR